jgi:hypothetical protein
MKQASFACLLLGVLFNSEDGRGISSEKLVDFQQTTRLYIPKDITLHNHRCENLKSYISFIKFCKIGFL